MRFVGSFLGALVVVSLLLSIGVRLFGVFDFEDAGLVFHEVDLLSADERHDLEGVLGAGPRPGPLPPMSEIPPLEFRRTVRGFVQLELSVGTSGQVTDVKVLGSTLPASYHQQAIDRVRTRRYSPDVVDGQPVTGRRLEIVEFRMDVPTINTAVPPD